MYYINTFQFTGYLQPKIIMKKQKSHFSLNCAIQAYTYELFVSID